MAGPRDFSQDGAAGASGGGSGDNPSAVGSPNPPTMQDPGMTPTGGADPWQVQWGGWNMNDAGSQNAMYASLGENSGKWTKDPTTGQVYDAVNANGPGVGGPGGENASNLAGINDSMLKGSGESQDQVTAWDKAMGYAEGGLVTDGDGDNDSDASTPDAGSDSSDSGSKWQSMVNDAISKVNNALSYGYQLHGLSGATSGLPAGQQDSQAGSAGVGSPRYQDFNRSPNVEDRRNNPPMNPASQAVNNFEGKAYDLAQRAIPLDDQSENPLSQQAGINDVDNTKGAIPDEEQ